MPLEYRNAREVAEGDCLRAVHAVCLANAVNDRLIYGPGNMPWRIHAGILNSMRQFRLPDSGGAFPSQAELLEYYLHFDPDESSSEFPIADYGTAEGVSPASPMGAFLVGRDGVGTEYTRTVIVNPLFPGSPDELPTTLAEKWFVGAQERGAYDVEAGVLDAPMFEAAQSIWVFEHGSNNTIHRLQDDGGPPSDIGLSAYDPQANPHGRTYGSYHPEPERVADEEHCEPSGDVRVNHEIKFTKLDDSATYTFPGTCPPSSTHGALDHVRAIYDSPLEYIVIDYAGTKYHFPKSEWIEGPYTGFGRLAKDRASHQNRITHAFLMELRGTAAQIEDLEVPERAPDWDRFFNSQYRHAPAYGQWEDPTLTAIYPIFSTTTFAGSTALDCDQGGSAWALHDGYCLAGFYAEVTNPVGEVTLELRVAGVVVSTMTLDSTTPARLDYFDQPQTTGSVTVNVAADSSGTADLVSLQIAELWDYRPGIHDAYVLNRIRTTDGDGGAEVDGDPRFVDDNADWMAAHLAEGWTVAKAGSVVDETAAATTNPTFQAYRRFVRNRIRWVRRQEFNKVHFDGTDSILYFERYLPGGVANGADIFRGIAPSPFNVSSGSIEAAVEYEVRGDAGAGDSVTYNGVVYAPGSTFTGVAGVADYDYSGSPKVLELEGIRPDALPGGESNEWCLWIQTIPFSDSETNTFKVETYADHFPFIDRCNLFSVGDTGTLPSYLKRHFNDASFTAPLLGLLNPENPDAYRYIDTLNTNLGLGAQADEFADSCRVYARPYRLKSVTSFFDSGKEWVRVKIHGRLRTSDNAPETIDDSTLIDWLDDEDRRTDENALVMYEQWPGTPCAHLTGDESGNASTNHQDIENGACLPRFHFTKLIEKPFIPSPNAQRAMQAPRRAEWFAAVETYLRYGCEGFIDAQTTEDLANCAQTVPAGASAFYDYRWANLLAQISSLRGVPPTLPPIAPANDGVGQLPGARADAELFNVLVRAVNALTTVRVPIPSQLEVRIYDYDAAATAIDWTAEAGACGDSGRIVRFVQNQELLPLSLTTAGSWTPAGTQVTALSRQEVTDNCAGGLFPVERTKAEVEFRWVPTVAAFLNALDSDLLELLETDPMILVEITEVYHIPIIEEDDPGEFAEGGQGWTDTAPTTETVYCALVDAGRIETAIADSDLALWRDGVGQPLNARRAEHVKTLDLEYAGNTPIVRIPTIDCDL